MRTGGQRARERARGRSSGHHVQPGEPPPRDPELPPSPEFAAQANAQPELYEEARADRLAFWARQANDLVTWQTPFTETLDWSQAPVARWFADGTLNAAYNAVDRHVEAGLGDRVAIHFEGEPGDTRTVTYAELQRDVSRAANALAALGVETGDRVVIYLPMVVEAVVAMLACARLGAPHSVVFGGFSADALRSRIADAEAKLVITADGGYRRGAASALKPAVDEALAPKEGADPTTVEHVLVVRRTGQDTAWTEGRDVWWHDALEAADPTHAPVWVEAEHPLFILYTSGTTGSPRASSTRRAAISRRPRTRTATCSISRPRPTSTGARPTSAGSRATRTSSTARCSTARRR